MRHSKYEMLEAKAEARNQCHRISMKRVADYIGVMMVQWQDEADTIFAPYHIKSIFNLMLQYTLAPIHG
jgi:hypothetical protein